MANRPARERRATALAALPPGINDYRGMIEYLKRELHVGTFALIEILGCSQKSYYQWFHGHHVPYPRYARKFMELYETVESAHAHGHRPAVPAYRRIER